jgi:hypothetical protein
VAGSITIIDTSIPTPAERNISRMIYFSEWRIRIDRSKPGEYAVSLASRSHNSVGFQPYNKRLLS